ncbi:hypothetical protein GALMADRAFT_210241 [Galerina marginata CBS 339.88]|uniref:Trichothecene 3-O-acetyltransferase-like N-terminal domain-containing protein n=1 Tax=Galerina marginata (strain CBS 339.88) TaxID=685588 RepID=A0A067TB38_GALM3|nr:hypothetical protein GALMADRAFT_210241 [Galerina marginata CBS 339.88]
MDRLAIKKELDEELDILGQQPGLGIYTQLCLCFSVPYASSHATIIYKLTNGLERLAAGFPWVAGQVVNEGAGEANTGIFKIKPLEKIPRLVVKDLRGDSSLPTMDDLRRADFPFSMLDESIIAPRRTIPGSPDEPTPDASPVFLVQANFITGGLVLTFVGNHGAMDMTGQGQVIHLLAKACRGEPFTNEELASGNLARRDLVPLLDDSYEPGPELARQLVNPASFKPTEANVDAPTKSTWAYFAFSATSLVDLKSQATKSLPTDAGAGYISTDDALSAFIWQRIAHARLPRLTSTTNTTLARAVDPRRYLSIPPTYPGVIQNMAYTTSPLPELVSSPLGTVASHLRAAVDPKTSDLGHRTRALATLLSRSPDKNVASVTATLDLSADLMVSSWAKEKCYELDFGFELAGGGDGRPEAVRRPRFVPVESLIYLMPRRGDGEVVVGMCLRDVDLDGLRADGEFARYGKYVG